MTRRGSRRGRPYQPMPPPRRSWVARLIIVVVVVFLVIGMLAIVVGTQ
jgi:hypothetical protein